MSIHYRQITDTFSILNYLQNHCLWRKNGQKLVLYYLENSKLPTKSSFVEKKTVKIGTILSRKWSKEPSWLAMCSVYIRNELPTGLPARFNAIQHKGDILPIRTCGDFYVSQGGPVKLDSMWQHRLTRLVRDRYMYSIRITI